VASSPCPTGVSAAAAVAAAVVGVAEAAGRARLFFIRDFRAVLLLHPRPGLAGSEITMREQELLALVDSLKHWRHYLLDAPFQIKTDHKSLEYLQTQPHLSGRLVRWSG